MGIKDLMVHTLIHTTEVIQTIPPLTIGHQGEIQTHIQDKKVLKVIGKFRIR